MSKIAFACRGDIKRDGIRVGWIERRDDYGPVTWRVRLTPASGKPGVVGEYGLRREARQAALDALAA
jgi:hypothetical protein